LKNPTFVHLSYSPGILPATAFAGIPLFSQQSLVLIGALAGIILVLATALGCIGYKYRAATSNVEIVTYDPIQ
jgi:hypothetical protein